MSPPLYAPIHAPCGRVAREQIVARPVVRRGEGRRSIETRVERALRTFMLRRRRR